MISGGIKVNQFTEIQLILEAKFEEDLLLLNTNVKQISLWPNYSW